MNIMNIVMPFLIGLFIAWREHRRLDILNPEQELKAYRPAIYVRLFFVCVFGLFFNSDAQHTYIIICAAEFSVWIFYSIPLLKTAKYILDNNLHHGESGQTETKDT